ncbi:hypothetical protein ACFLTD_01935, partial [Elusimicrobiota bacterium]
PELSACSQTGYIGVELKTTAEVKVTESEGLEGVPVQKLPHELINRSISPMLYGFKYLRHPYNLTMEIKKHKKVTVPMSTIDSGSAVTLFTEDGKIVHRLVYEVRNSAKQFMELGLPKKADIWTVFVGGNPVEASINSDGKLLVPLIRSRQENNVLKTFNVEIIYCLTEEKFTEAGLKNSALPAVDIIISQMIWSVYMPSDYRYLYFKSTLEKEEQVRNVIKNVLGDKRIWKMPQAGEELGIGGSISSPDAPAEVQEAELDAYYQQMPKKSKSSFRNAMVDEGRLQMQVKKEMLFSKRMDELKNMPQSSISSGQPVVLPMYIKIPTGGQLYRFARTIIKPEDPLTLSVSFVREWLIKAVKTLLLILVLYILYRMRRKIKGLIDRICGFISKRSTQISGIMKSPMAPFMFAGGVIFFLFVSRPIALVLFLVFWVSAAIQYAEKRKEKLQSGKEARIIFSESRFQIPVIIGIVWFIGLILVFGLVMTTGHFILQKLFMLGIALFIIYVFILLILFLFGRKKEYITETVYTAEDDGKSGSE